MAMPTFTPTENYAALQILTEAQLNALAASVQDYFNNIVRNNMNQIALDVFGNTYSYNNNGVQTQSPFLAQAAAIIADNETISGNWSFNGTVSFANVVTSTSTFTSSGQQRCKTYLATANQTISNNTEEAITFNADSYDIGAMHDTGINPSRVSIPGGGSGLYSFVAQIRFTANATGRREIHLYKNGSKVATVVGETASASFDSYLQLSYQDQSTAGDYFEIFVYQNSGAGLDLVFGERSTFFSAMKVW